MTLAEVEDLAARARRARLLPHQEKALIRLVLGPVPLRWVRSPLELDGMRGLLFRGLAEFDHASRSYRLVSPRNEPPNSSALSADPEPPTRSE